MKLVLIGVLTIVAFAGGLFGVMALLPSPEPEHAAEAEADTLDAAAPHRTSVADSLTRQHAGGGVPGSVEQLQELLAAAQAEIPLLQARIQELEQSLQSQTDRETRAQALSGELARLDEDQLRDLLAQLDGDVLADLYIAASPRNRVKLLQALPSRRGSALVERITAGDRRSIPVEPAPSADLSSDWDLGALPVTPATAY